MHDDRRRITIGELARRTGLTVRILRFYADSGLVAPAARSDAGYRLYDADAAARAELVRTLRELGVDLPTIRRVLARELTVADVAAAHAAALETQIRVLRARRAVLQAAARRGSEPQEMKLMHRLARLTGDERRRIVAEFVDYVFEGIDADSGIVRRMRAAMPDLPDEPTDEQLEAWIELAELVSDDDFRATIRRMAERGAADRRAAEGAPDPADARRVADLVAGRAGAALDAGIDPAGPAAAPGRRGACRRLLRPPRPPRRPRVPRLARRGARHVRRPPRRALLAAAGGHERLAAAAVERNRVGMADRGPASASRRIASAVDQKSAERRPS